MKGSVATAGSKNQGSPIIVCFIKCIIRKISTTLTHIADQSGGILFKSGILKF